VTKSSTAPRRDKATIESFPHRPKALPVNADGIPAELRARPQWVAWRFERRHGRWTKVPIDPKTGRAASSTDPSTWGRFEQAVAYSEAHQLDGGGFVFAPDDPYAGVDLDDAIDSETGTVAEWAIPILDKLNSYTELSPSGTGVKVIVRARKSGKRCKGMYQGRKVEVYNQHRFFALTGAVLAGMPTEIADRQQQLDQLYARVFERQSDRKHTKPDGQPTGKSASAARSNSHPTTLSDEDILGLANRAANGDKFRRVWAGDTSGHDDDHSRADESLCTLLAYYTRDKRQIDRLFRQSGLMRDKWDSRRGSRTYGEMTIDAALDYQQDHYEPRHVMGMLRFSTNGQDTAEYGPHLTDRGNAIRLVQRHGSDLRHCHPWNKWIVWDGPRWRIDDVAVVMRFAKLTIAGLFCWAKQKVEQISKHLEETAHETEA
jgi:primase-polymerase (primpol)-like protein